MQNELVSRWDEYDLKRKEQATKAYRELGYKEFYKHYTRADRDLIDTTEEKIHSTNVEASKSLILDLIRRVKHITGDITDWSNVEAKMGSYNRPVLNGYVEGKLGRASVESIYAGGYNIQRLHIRILVHEIN